LKRRIFKCCCVSDKLGESVIEITFFLFVFPRKEISLPDIGESFASARFGRALLKCEPFTRWVGRDRILMAQQGTNVIEMGLSRRALGKRDRLPFFGSSGNRVGDFEGS